MRNLLSYLWDAFELGALGAFIGMIGCVVTVCGG